MPGRRTAERGRGSSPRHRVQEVPLLSSHQRPPVPLASACIWLGEPGDFLPSCRSPMPVSAPPGISFGGKGLWRQLGAPSPSPGALSWVPLCRGGTDLAIWAGVRSGQSHCRVWIFLGWQLPCPAFAGAVVCRQSLPLCPPPTPKSHARLWLPCSLSPALLPTVAAGVPAPPAATTAAGRPSFWGGWKDVAGNVGFAKLVVGQELRAGMGTHQGDGDNRIME